MVIAFTKNYPKNYGKFYHQNMISTSANSHSSENVDPNIPRCEYLYIIIGWVKLKCLLAVLKGLFVVEQQVAFTVQHLHEIHFQFRNIYKISQIHLINTSW